LQRWEEYERERQKELQQRRMRRQAQLQAAEERLTGFVTGISTNKIDNKGGEGLPQALTLLLLLGWLRLFDEPLLLHATPLGIVHQESAGLREILQQTTYADQKETPPVILYLPEIPYTFQT
jgi:hypothetical protein